MSEFFSVVAVVFFVVAFVAAKNDHAKAWRGVLFGLTAMAFFLGLGSPVKPPETYVTMTLVLSATLVVGAVWAYARTSRKEVSDD